MQCLQDVINPGQDVGVVDGLAAKSPDVNTKPGRFINLADHH